MTPTVQETRKLLRKAKSITTISGGIYTEDTPPQDDTKKPNQTKQNE